MTRDTDRPAGEPLLMTLHDVAADLRLSPRGLRKLLSSGRFGPDLIRLGRAVCVRRSDLLAWIADGCPPAAAWQREGVADDQ